MTSPPKQSYFVSVYHKYSKWLVKLFREAHIVFLMWFEELNVIAHAFIGAPTSYN